MTSANISIETRTSNCEPSGDTTDEANTKTATVNKAAPRRIFGFASDRTDGQSSQMSAELTGRISSMWVYSSLFHPSHNVEARACQPAAMERAQSKTNWVSADRPAIAGRT